MTAKELSGVFTDTQKWIEAFDLLAQKDCGVEHLRIYHNSPEQLEATAKALHGNTGVRTFEVGAAAGVGSQALADLLKVNSSICNLTVQSLPTADDVAAVARGLSCCTSLQTVTFHSLTAQDVARVSAALSNSSSAGALQQLHLPKCRLDVAAAAALHELLLSHPSLTVLHLQEACFEHPTTSSSSRATASSTATSPCFSLHSNNSSSSSIDNEPSSDDTSVSTEPASPPLPASAGAQLFTAALAAHPSLLRLDLSKTTGLAADCTGVQQLGAYLATAPHLQEVMLAEAGLGETAAQQLAAAMLQSSCESGAAPTSTQAVSHDESGAACTQATRLHSSSGPSSGVSNASPGQILEGLACSGVRVLDVSGNRVGPAGATALGGALGACCSKLAVLRLSGNELGSQGLAGLCAGLGEGRCQVAELDVSGNHIKGFDGLAAFLGSPAARHLTTLTLANNCFNDEAATGLAAAVASSSSSSSLARLDLSQNWIGDAGAKALAGMLQAHAAMSRLHLQKNRIRRPGIDALVDAALANQVVQELCLDGNRAVDRMSKMTLDDLARALTQRRRGLGSSRRSSAATATSGSDDGTCCGSSRSSSRRASNAALAATDCTNEASGSSSNSRRVSADAAAAAVVTVGTCCEAEWSTVGRMAVDDNNVSTVAAVAAAAAAMTQPSTAMEYNQDDIITPRASKVARLSDSSSNDGTAAAGGGDCSCNAPVSPFAAGNSAAAASAAATVDPTRLFQVPLGFADRLVQRRSYSFEYWFQQRSAQQAASSIFSSTGSDAFVETVSHGSHQGSNGSSVSSSRIVTSAVDGAAVAAAKAESMPQSAELGHFSAADVANNSSSVCVAGSDSSKCSGDTADLRSGQGMADVFPASLLGVLGPGGVDRTVNLTAAKAASLSGWLLDDCCAAKLVLPDLAPGVVRKGSSSRQDSMGRGRTAATRLDSVSECDSELLSLSPSEGNSGVPVVSRDVAMPGAATSAAILCDSIVATTSSCDVLCHAVGPVVMLRGIRTSSGSVGGASRSSSRYVSCSTSSGDGGGGDSSDSSSCDSSRPGSPTVGVCQGVRKLGTGHLVVRGGTRVGGGGLSRFAKPGAPSTAPDSY